MGKIFYIFLQINVGRLNKKKKKEVNGHKNKQTSFVSGQSHVLNFACSS